MFATFCHSSGKLWPPRIPRHPTFRSSQCITTSVITEARDTLVKSLALLSVVRAEDYGKVLPPPFGGSIGGHVRHCIDHFSKLLQGDRSKVVRYDDRTGSRGGDIEYNPAAGKAALEGILKALRDVELQKDEQLGQSVRVAFMKASDFKEYEMPSTMEREISFLNHHAIHHLAMIKVMAATLGYQLGDELGLAPSTLAAKKTNAGQAEVTVPPSGSTAVVDRAAKVSIEGDHYNTVHKGLETDTSASDIMAICQCWKSKKFPYCDGAHKKHNKATGDNVWPLIIKL